MSKTEKQLTEKITNTEQHLTEKIGMIDAKLSVLSDSLLKTQAEVKVLKSTE